ncbi:transporter substrate-binding domain-containing protein [Caldibacillus lycopersici]|uniref:Transporter substrate-binding domain-containing protein n=1 Tax=Perspicuibacillus lycopersici TaxID=1325689 RepID=A0AAE3LPJ1_9BACI|nr:transporter substrate-binding domain-containing protein [Perspicuibacillus lycopersici]MCU9612399.1 transporter substrate-binding domain-containing protein [Perspicuibacillus lycopersici]
MKKWVISSFLLVIVIGMLAACGTAEKSNGSSSGSGEKKILKMATSADFPPFESYDAEGNFEGFDIELAHIIADELGYELQIEDMQFDGLIGALQSGRVDMVLSGMSADEKRKENVDFSMEYHRSGEMFISQPDAGIDKIDDLQGKVVGVQLGTIQEEGADELSEQYGFEVKKVDNATILIQELVSGRIDVAYMDKTVATGYIKAQGFVGFDDPTTSSPGMGIAFPKGSELVDDVNKVLEELKANGKIAELEEKWIKE